MDMHCLKKKSQVHANHLKPLGEKLMDTQKQSAETSMSAGFVLGVLLRDLSANINQYFRVKLTCLLLTSLYIQLPGRVVFLQPL
jgi:hypothetical protein